MSLGWSNKEKLNGRGMWNIQGTGEVHMWFWWGNQRERYHLKDLSVDGRILLKMYLQKIG